MLGIHNFTVLSLEAVSISSPVGENRTQNIASLWPLNLYARVCGLMFQIIKHASIEQEANNEH